MTGVEIAYIALAAASTTIAAVGAVRQGQAAANAAEFNADVAAKNAQAAEAQAQAASEAQKRDSQRRMGAAVAAYGASGVSLSEGSPVDVLAESARMAELDNLTLKYNYRLKALGYSTEASLARANASNSRTAGYLSGAGTALGGASNIAGNFA